MISSSEEEQKKVLIVDDDPMMRLLICGALGQNGFRIIEANNGIEALSAFDATKPDIVLLDVMMPEMDGFEVCAEIRRRSTGRQVPILMVTGVDDVGSIKKAYETGATDFISKPFKSFILSERVRYILRAGSLFCDLKRNQELLARAQQIAKLGSWEWDVRKNVYSFSYQLPLICGIDLTPDKMIWDDFITSVHPDDRDNLLALVQQALHHGKSFNLDHRILLSDGSERIVSQNIEVEMDEGGVAGRLCGTVQDVTKRKMAELLEVDRNRILRMVINDESLPGILHQIVGVLDRQRPEAMAAICLVEDERIHMAAADRLPRSFIQALDGMPIGLESGCCGLAAYSGRMVAAEDIAHSRFWNSCREAALTQSIRACFSTPIISGKGRVLGAIDLYYKNPHYPSDDDLQLAEKMGQLAAIAIEQKLLAHQAQHDS